MLVRIIVKNVVTFSDKPKFIALYCSSWLDHYNSRQGSKKGVKGWVPRERHLSPEITQCYLPQNTGERAPP